MSKNILIKILQWLPSILISIFFVLNAFDKISNSNQSDKIVSNQFFLISVGLVLLIATALFLWNKTIIIGTSILSIYMSFIVLIHIFKGKPYEATLLLVIGIVFACFLRKPDIFMKKEK